MPHGCEISGRPIDKILRFSIHPFDGYPIFATEAREWQISSSTGGKIELPNPRPCR